VVLTLFDGRGHMNGIELSIISLFLAILTGCAKDYPYGSGPGWGHMMYYGYGGGVMWILLLVLIGILLYFVIQTAKTKGGVGVSEETPLDILKKRYAKGEITKEEFDRIKRELSE